MITVFGVQVDSLAQVPTIIEKSLKHEYRVNDLGGLELGDKMAIVKKMDELGFFYMRNGVNFAAKLLGLSRTTIYKYINE